ncbi:hypothetical protein CYMTET_46868 [Cymbomonas tetramitiformis]|uniref:histidine kinase n=1 Tax=Cymbomonas tetramitiformis TaxID=36881 RepID=A0AAE0BX41_9CHLO|nr:hypothetical protein CYMTET_46868 [Cymbomonas tetramitiformis]
MALFCYGHLLLTDFGVLPTYNIESAGGSSTTGNRALFPIQYVHWSCNLPIMISTFATLECLPRELVLRHVFLSTSMSCAGILALLMPRELFPIPMTYSFYALGKITVDHYHRSTEVSSHDADLKARSQFQVLHQEQELHVREEAQRIYVAYVFHEVRNPLNGITGFLDSLNWELKDTLTSRSSVSSDLEAMGHCVHLMSQLLDNSLDLAKLEEGKLALKETPDDLVSFLYQTSNMISRVKTSSSANGILPITEIVMQDPRGNLVPPSALPVYFDRCRLSQILINLLSNALRHTQHGFVKLRVVVSPADSKADVLVNFEVQDTGCGIPENAQQALFQKYMCAQTGFDKTGLGLLLAKKLVSLMSGQITVQSPWQQGTTGCCFSFVLKMRRAAPPSLRKMVAQETTPSITVSENLLATHGKRWRVLNADDQQFNRVLMRRKLQSISSSMNLEWEIEDMETGEEVLACMKINPAAYDVILLDEHFDNAGGVLKGTDVIAELKRSGIARLPVFISCSGNCTQSDMERYEGCGADIVFGKPTPTPARIAMDISRVLAKRLELFGMDRQETAVGTTHQVSRTGVLT